MCMPGEESPRIILGLQGRNDMHAGAVRWSGTLHVSYISLVPSALALLQHL